MNLSFYRADSTYCDYLRKVDKCVPYTFDEKQMRPFVGILLEIEGYNYYAPLTSPKSKHQMMKNQIDFLKINNGVYGAVNFNNMIPIHDNCLFEIEFSIAPADSKADINYKNLLSNQLSWCNANKGRILSMAYNLYTLISTEKAFEALKKRTCNFKEDEKQYLKYCEMNKLPLFKKMPDMEQKVKEAGFMPSKTLISNISKLNAITGKNNSIRDISIQYKSGITDSNSKVNDLINKIGNECIIQEKVHWRTP